MHVICSSIYQSTVLSRKHECSRVSAHRETKDSPYRKFGNIFFQSRWSIQIFIMTEISAKCNLETRCLIQCCFNTFSTLLVYALYRKTACKTLFFLWGRLYLSPLLDYYRNQQQKHSTVWKITGQDWQALLGKFSSEDTDHIIYAIGEWKVKDLRKKLKYHYLKKFQLQGEILAKPLLEKKEKRDFIYF